MLATAAFVAGAAVLHDGAGQEIQRLAYRLASHAGGPQDRQDFTGIDNRRHRSECQAPPAVVALVVQQGPGSLARSYPERCEPCTRTLHESPPPPTTDGPMGTVPNPPAMDACSHRGGRYGA
ncbi:hypothetical protein SSPO_000950 [Streptomyces antimycoticus]|uniref:Uncharacterized protein n=1 Tax=Streptomyces antimycoticus TaxID=68175 RepID=A0A499UU31_9ACTN|nr:hypothetical protein SSPO_000950 [Streptomyces antimycoticus]